MIQRKGISFFNCTSQRSLPVKTSQIELLFDTSFEQLNLYLKEFGQRTDEI